MTDPDQTPSLRRSAFRNAALVVVCVLVGGAAGWLMQSRAIHADPAGNLSAEDRAAVEKVVEDYIMAHPDILPRAMAELEQRQNASQVAAARGDIERTDMGTVLGNPKGTITLVEFTDYACSFCRRSVADVDALIAANPDLRVVVRELPILSPASADAARMAIAAAQQGRYAAFHKAMFEHGHPDAQAIAAAAAAAGLDMARARKTVADPATEAELVRNVDLAKRLGFSGTPSWVIGDTTIAGAVGGEQLAKALADARS